jgi:Tfp pilus assembly protein PilV
MKLRAPHNRRHGTTLVEALIAFALTTLGILALLRGQAALRLQADVTRERAEAVRLAQAAMEQMRSFASASAYATLASLPSDETASLASNTQFTIHRNLVMHGGTSRQLQADVSVGWRDRQGHANTVSLSSTIAQVDPALSGRLLQPPLPAATVAPMGRNAFIPVTATELGDGRSAWRPPGAAGVAWLFDDASGRPLAVCTLAGNGTPTADQLSDCQSLAARLVTGHVQFATGDLAGAAEALRPDSPALGLAMQLTLTEGDATRSTCFDDALTAPVQTDVHYACLVAVDPQSGHWSGRVDVQPEGWTLGTTRDAYRVCRYSDDYDRSGSVGNIEHPLDYHAVGDALPDQNFLVVRGDHACPADTPADPVQGHFVDANTVEQAPSPTPTPAAAPH